MKHVRVSGCVAFIYYSNPKSKVHVRASPGIMLGCNDYGVYTVERITDGKIVNSVHVTFDEENFPGLEKDDSSSSGEGMEYSSEDESSSDVGNEVFCPNSSLKKTHILPMQKMLTGKWWKMLDDSQKGTKVHRKDSHIALLIMHRALLDSR